MDGVFGEPHDETMKKPCFKVSWSRRVSTKCLSLKACCVSHFIEIHSLNAEIEKSFVLLLTQSFVLLTVCFCVYVFASYFLKCNSRISLLLTFSSLSAHQPSPWCVSVCDLRALATGIVPDVRPLQ